MVGCGCKHRTTPGVECENDVGRGRKVRHGRMWLAVVRGGRLM